MMDTTDIEFSTEAMEAMAAMAFNPEAPAALREKPAPVVPVFEPTPPVYTVDPDKASPVWVAEDMIDLTVLFTHLANAPVRYTAQRGASGYCGEIFDRAAAGEFGEVAAYTAPPAPVPAQVKKHQIFRAMVKLGVITAQEALATLKGDLPAALDAALSTLSDDEQLDARMMLGSDTEITRGHAAVGLVATAMRWTADQVDDLFRMAGKL